MGASVSELLADVGAVKGEAAARTAASKGRAVWWKPKPGLNQIRILPPYEMPITNDMSWRRVYRQYWKVFSLGPNRRWCIPPNANGVNGPDPYQDYIDDLVAAGDKASLEEKYRVRIQERFAFVVVDRAAEDVGAQFFESTSNNFQRIMAIVLDPEVGFVWDVHPSGDGEQAVGAVDLKITYTPGTETKNGIATYQIDASRRNSPLGTEAQMRDWLTRDWLNEFRIGETTDPEYIAAILEGTDEKFWEERRAGGDAASLDEFSRVDTSLVRHSYLAGTNFWMSGDTGVEKVSVEGVCTLLAKGENPRLMHYSKEGGWQRALEGFEFEIEGAEVAPTSPPETPPTSPPDAPTGSNGFPEELRSNVDAVEAEFSQLTSDVGNDARDALGGAS